MAIYKSKHTQNFTVLNNEIFKAKLSIEAIGLLAYFLSLPHDWIIYKTQLHSQLNLGKDKLDRIFKELQKSGYVITIEKRNRGKIEYEHIVYDKPFNSEPNTEKPLTEKPYTEKPYTANPQLLNTKELSIEELNTKELNSFVETSSTDRNVVVDDSFNLFWDLYNKKVGDKTKCSKKWNKLLQADKDKIMATLPAFLKTISDKQFQPFPETYLNQGRWNDEVIALLSTKKTVTYCNQLGRFTSEKTDEEIEKLRNTQGIIIELIK